MSCDICIIIIVIAYCPNFHYYLSGPNSELRYLQYYYYRNITPISTTIAAILRVSCDIYIIIHRVKCHHWLHHTSIALRHHTSIALRHHTSIALRHHTSIALRRQDYVQQITYNYLSISLIILAYFPKLFKRE